MLSRRNIRVKVMQTLYTLDSMSGGVKPGEATIYPHEKNRTKPQAIYLPDIFYYRNGALCRNGCG